jgi:5S rRNA maturation endonuclease (ribonuclease M5)
MTKQKHTHAPITIPELLELFEQKRDVRTLVEGKNDVLALAELGFSYVEELEGPLYKVVERYEKGETIQLLVDLDKEGKRLYALLKADLTQRGVRIDDAVREALFRCPVRQIEDLATWIERSQNDNSI